MWKWTSNYFGSELQHRISCAHLYTRKWRKICCLQMKKTSLKEARSNRLYFYGKHYHSWFEDIVSVVSNLNQHLENTFFLSASQILSSDVLHIMHRFPGI